MPGTTRYSATFDRPYEEDDQVPAEPPVTRRGRSQSLQATSVLNGRPYTPLGDYITPRTSRSSSTDSGSPRGVEIPTRTAGKAAVKAHNNPFQFVKVGTCPLYKKAEEQLKKVKEVKKPDVLKEEEEEWQSNLDSWKSRRRKMSEDVFRRQEEIRQFEMEEQVQQAPQKKTKTFSEMVESRVHRGRTLSLCLLSSPLDLQNWELENNSKKHSNNIHSSGGSEENSNVNSEDECGNYKEPQEDEQKENHNVNGLRTNGNKCLMNGTSNLQNGNYDKMSELDTSQESISQKENAYVDSGLESISSSHRAGDIPDSGSDFSQDSGSSMDSESPDSTLTGIKLLQEYSPKVVQMNGNVSHKQSPGTEISFKLCLSAKVRDCGFQFSCGKDQPQIVTVTSVKEGSVAQSEGVTKGDQILRICGKDVSSMKYSEIQALLKDASEKKVVELVFWRSSKAENKENHSDQNTTSSVNSTPTSVQSAVPEAKINSEETPLKSSKPTSLKTAKIPKEEKESVSKERSIESENEMYVDDFEELSRKPCEPSNINSVNNTDEKTPAKLTPVSSTATAQTDPNLVLMPPVSCKIKEAPKSKLEEQVKAPINQNKTKNKSSKKNSKTIQRTNVPCEITGESGVNVIFKSPTVYKVSENPKELVSNNLETSVSEIVPLLTSDIPPVEKVAEEMEKLILEQLEQEERAKELAAEMQANGVENGLIAHHAEPPKVKPPPPPTSDVQKAPSLGRVNSTKRIKKEIHKRRSNFLGIENTDDKAACDELCIPPPPALQDILKAEMELDRESRRQLETAAAQRLSLEESELVKKEQEIIKNLETEERQRQFYKNLEGQSNETNTEEKRIQILKDERKRMEEERISNEEQRLRLEEEKQLREREEYIRKQEGESSAPVQLSAPLLSVAANSTNAKTPIITSLSPETKSSVLLSECGGEGKTVLSVSPASLINEKGSKVEEKAKPVVPPKPVKKKEAIRKERERLRQEQEALQREREEYRQKILKEQEEIVKSHQKPHAFEAAVSRIGPVPKPAFSPQLTPLSTPPNARENATTFTSRSHHGAQNGLPATRNAENSHLASHPRSRQNRPVSSRGKTAQNETWGQQKVPSVKKQNHDSLTESRYNQNHWLIQEAEMRRIAELKERQHASQLYSAYSQTHLAEDDACSNSPSNLPQSPNYSMTDPPWNYPQTVHSSQGIQKYPPAISSDKPFAVLPREPPSQAPTKPSRVIPLERPEQMLSVSGRKRCSHCNEELGRGAAMIIESLQLYYHIHCFQCCVCQAQLGNGSCGTDVRVRNNKLHCHNCYSNDEAGLKFSQV